MTGFHLRALETLDWAFCGCAMTPTNLTTVATSHTAMAPIAPIVPDQIFLVPSFVYRITNARTILIGLVFYIIAIKIIIIRLTYVVELCRFLYVEIFYEHEEEAELYDADDGCSFHLPISHRVSRDVVSDPLDARRQSGRTTIFIRLGVFNFIMQHNHLNRCLMLRLKDIGGPPRKEQINTTIFVIVVRLFGGICSNNAPEEVTDYQRR